MNSGYLLDTNHCSKLLFRKNNPIERYLSEIGDTPVSINSIIAGELNYMAEKSVYLSENREIISSFLDEITILPLDRKTCEIFAIMKAGLFRKFGPRDRKRMRKIRIHQIGFSDHDIWIAASAKAHEITLVTADKGFSRMQQIMPLVVENWIH